MPTPSEDLIGPYRSIHTLKARSGRPSSSDRGVHRIDYVPVFSTLLNRMELSNLPLIGHFRLLSHQVEQAGALSRETRLNAEIALVKSHLPSPEILIDAALGFFKNPAMLTKLDRNKKFDWSRLDIVETKDRFKVELKLLITGIFLAFPAYTFISSDGADLIHLLSQILDGLIGAGVLISYLKTPLAEAVKPDSIHWRLAFAKAVEADIKNDQIGLAEQFRNALKELFRGSTPTTPARSTATSDSLVVRVCEYVVANKNSDSVSPTSERSAQLVMAEFLHNPFLLFLWLGRYGGDIQTKASDVSDVITKFKKIFPELSDIYQQWVNALMLADVDGDVVIGKGSKEARELIEKQDLVAMAELILRQAQLSDEYKIRMLNMMTGNSIWNSAELIGARSSIVSATKTLPLVTDLLQLKSPGVTVKRDRADNSAWAERKAEINREHALAVERLRNCTQSSRSGREGPKGLVIEKEIDSLAFEVYFFVLHYIGDLSSEQKNQLLQIIIDAHEATDDGHIKGETLPSPVIKVVKLLMEPKNYELDHALGIKATQFYYRWLRQKFEIKLMKSGVCDAKEIETLFLDLAKRVDKLERRSILQISDIEVIELTNFLESLFNVLNGFYLSKKQGLLVQAMKEVSPQNDGSTPSESEDVLNLRKIREVIKQLKAILLSHFNPVTYVGAGREKQGEKKVKFVPQSPLWAGILRPENLQEWDWQRQLKAVILAPRPSIEAARSVLEGASREPKLQTVLASLKLLSDQIDQDIGETKLLEARKPHATVALTS